MLDKVKQNRTRFKVILGILLILITISVCVAMYAWAWYTTFGNGSIEAQVAKWDVQFGMGNTVFTNSYDYVVSERLAPGTEGQYTMVLNSQDTEVAYAYKIEIRNIINKPQNLKFYNSSDEEIILTKVSTNPDTYTGIAYPETVVELNNGKAVTTEKDLSIKWKWPYETGNIINNVTGEYEGDAADTADGENAGEMSFEVSLLAWQIDPTDSANYVNATVKNKPDNKKTRIGTYDKTEPILPEVRINVLNTQTGTYEEVQITEANVNQYIGKKVDYNNSGLTWSIFYVDFANKYGDGEGTVYLKADYPTEISEALSISYDSDKTKMYTMNKEWANSDGIIDNENEQAAAYMCDPSKWEKYKNSNAKYALGGPSVDMYMDSLKQCGSTAIDYKVEGWGYGFLRADGSYSYGTDLGVFPQNELYTSPDLSGNWYLASPSIDWRNSVCLVNGRSRSIICNYYIDARGLCPLVCLDSD